ncbi:hypothetical protein [Nocardia gamkensis]|uniref:Uncharacterized protein n=1 Tax=Nocardia gamkensis TaxID=352869 RepID=A0A7X6L5M2_9NOCA|nr:hypothetical protein [Nocardia gamkensis]NKY28274.1 hypothetical protein [Nocardia gamkensis]NQE70702.1 hypothetical protein [Nocardia gamkensis]
MNDSFAPPGGQGRGAPSTWHAASAVVAACLGAGGIGVGALLGIGELNGPAGGIPDASKDFDAWWAASRIRAVQEILLGVSALLAVVLVAGAILMLFGKSAGRPAVLTGSAWGFFGGLITATYGGEYGLAARSAASPFYLIVGAALCTVALGAIVTSPLGHPTAAPAPLLPRPGHPSAVPQFGLQPPMPQFGPEPPMPQSGAQPPASQFGQHPPTPQSRPPY